MSVQGTAKPARSNGNSRESSLSVVLKNGLGKLGPLKVYKDPTERS